jgi:hypothetical protein
VYILSKQLDKEGAGRRDFARYQAYVRENRSRFPKSAYSLVSSDWYFNSTDHRCPHDARFVSFQLAERSNSEESSLNLEISLENAYQDGRIVLRYPRVFRYSFAFGAESVGHSDWRYDEFRVTETGHLLHEIEWWHRQETARWLIEADDVLYEWRPS